MRELGTRVDPARDEVAFDGKRVLAEDHVWLLLNKPKGIVCTASDPEGRRTVLDLVGQQGVRLYPVGRLDYNTEGVLLLTNDGDLANALLHPSRSVPRTYHVKLRGIVDPDDLDRLRQGVKLDTGETVAAANLFILGTTEANTWIELSLIQGLNRQVHRMVEAIGGTVLKLVRVSFAGLTADRLPSGRFRALDQAEVNQLRALVELPQETVRAAAVMPGRRSRNKPRSAAARKQQRSARKDGQRVTRREGERATRREAEHTAGTEERPRRPRPRPKRTRQ